MLKMRLFLWSFAVALVCLCGPAGCSSAKKGAVVTGKVVLPPGVHLAKEDVGNLRLVPDDKNAKVPGAVLKSDLTFEFKDVPPGKYKVGVHLSAYSGTKDSEKREATYKKVNERYNAESSSKLTYDVTADSPQSILIDLSKGTVTKQ